MQFVTFRQDMFEYSVVKDTRPFTPASTFNKVGYRVDGTVFVYSEATVSTYAMTMLNAYELIPNPPSPC